MRAIESLLAEKARLKAELNESEKKLNTEFHYLSENFGKMAMNSVLPFSSGQMEKVSSAFNAVNGFLLNLLPPSVGDEKRQKYQSILKSVEMAAAGIAYKYLTRFIK